MKPPQKTVLQTQRRKIAQNIIMSEEILSALYEKKVFEVHMIELIKAEKTETHQTYKMLELLQKRGPEAFDNFIEIIQQDYPWLATYLESRCRSAMNSRTASTETISSSTKIFSTEESDIDCGNEKITEEEMRAEIKRNQREVENLQKQMRQSRLKTELMASRKILEEMKVLASTKCRPTISNVKSDRKLKLKKRPQLVLKVDNKMSSFRLVVFDRASDSQMYARPKKSKRIISVYL